MKKEDTICDNCGQRYGDHNSMRIGNGVPSVYCKNGASFIDNKHYNVWVAHDNRWTNASGQDEDNPAPLSFEEADYLLKRSGLGLRGEIRLLITKANTTPTTIQKVSSVKIEDEEDRLRRILTGPRADECQCKMPRSQCDYHR